MKNTLGPTGLSLSQASSISNLAYQRALEISHKIHGINNATKTVRADGEVYEVEVGKPIPADVVKLIIEKAKLHATQAFLMTNVKAKEVLLNDLKRKQFETDLVEPERPKYETSKNIILIDENWGWDQLTATEMCEFLEHEAYAAHIGQFIHKDMPLDKLRRELPEIKSLEWMTIKNDEKSPVKVKPHHTSEQLLAVHEELASLHRTHEMRVNYFKAKVKNLVTLENARISKENGITQETINNTNNKLMNDYNALLAEYNGKILTLRQKFETNRQEDISTTASLRITVDSRFQDVIDTFLKNLDPKS